MPSSENGENGLQDSGENMIEWEVENTDSFSPENPERVGGENLETKEDSILKLSGFHPEIQDVSLKLSGKRKAETFSHIDIETFIERLDVSSLKIQTRNWYRRRMKTPENMAKWKAAKMRFESLGYLIKINSNTSISFEVKKPSVK